jgi:hypothetical protein
MKLEEIERLKYRSQYLLTPSSIECPFVCNVVEVVGNYFLYTHKDLIVTSAEQADTRIILLGDLFDYRSPEKGNQDILKDIIHLEFDAILDAIDRYTGRYVIIYHKSDKISLLHDPIAARKIYYCSSLGDVWIASQSHLLAEVLGFAKSTNPEIQDYYRSKAFASLSNANIGDTTYYDEIKQLMPNHFLDVNEFKIIRYWPRERIERRPLKEVTQEFAEIIKGYMESIINRYEVMLPVTAGKDSRILMAAAKRFKEKIYYYVNKSENMTDKDSDISVPMRLFSNENLGFHVLDPSNEVDKDFSEIYFYNNKFASKEYLPIIYNYNKNFGNRVNLPGNNPAAGLEYYKRKRVIKSGARLAHLNGVSSYSYAEDYYNKWIDERMELFQTFNIEMITLFYWEERLANWGTQIQLDKDIAQEDVNPFNSRDLVVLILSVNPKYIEIPYYRFHTEIIKLLWPELLNVPINPGWRTSLQKAFKAIGLLDLYYALRH